MTVHQRRGRYLEELHPGDVYRHLPGRTITDADNVFFSAISMNSQSLHYDAEFCATTEFGRPLVNSILTLGIVVGLSVGELGEGTSVANLGFGEVRFPAPVFVGDTLYAETEIVEVRPSGSRPTQGVVVYEHRGHNQRGELVCSTRRTALVRRIPREESS